MSVPQVRNRSIPPLFGAKRRNEAIFDCTGGKKLKLCEGYMKKIAITIGDYNGIGPEIIVKALNRLKLSANEVVIIGNKKFLPLDFGYEVLEIEAGESEVGQETASAGEFSYQCLTKACDLAQSGAIRAIVTAPVSKNALHLAGHYFSGQTEVIEKNLAKNWQKAEMLFVCDDFRVLLLTRHIPLKDVCISKDLIIEKIERINNILIDNFKIPQPKIALCSLNPHAGENGILGVEEIDEFAPALRCLQSTGINITEPLPADTLFVKAAAAIKNAVKQPYDCYVACYHDQGLIPMKVLAMDSAVNMTVGLDTVRTSPAHGTAYDIAGKNIADESSMIAAIKEALATPIWKV